MTNFNFIFPLPYTLSKYFRVGRRHYIFFYKFDLSLIKNSCQADPLINTHHSSSNDSLEQVDTYVFLKIVPSSHYSMDTWDLNQVNVIKPTLIVKGYPLLSIKSCPLLSVNGKSSDPLDYNTMSHT